MLSRPNISVRNIVLFALDNTDKSTRKRLSNVYKILRSQSYEKIHTWCVAAGGMTFSKLMGGAREFRIMSVLIIQLVEQFAMLCAQYGSFIYFFAHPYPRLPKNEYVCKNFQP
jgi:hypothetical protein